MQAYNPCIPLPRCAISLNPAMFSTARSTTTNSTPSRTPQDTQRKYAESLPFRVVRAPVPFTTGTALGSDYYSDDRRNFDWNSAYYESGGPYTATADDRARTPRHFVDSDRGIHNRKPMPDFPLFARLPNEQFIYDRTLSEFYPSSDYDDYSGTTITPSSYSLLPSDEFSFSTPESPDLSSDQSDLTPPSTPRDSRGQPSVLSTYPTIFRDIPEVGYAAPLQEADIARSFPSGSDGNVDPRREPVPEPPRRGNGAPAAPEASGEQPYAESVLSVESEDTVHRVARINAQYNAAASALYGALQRDPSFRQHPSSIPAVQRVSTPGIPTTPIESNPYPLFADGPLSSSPTQLLYSDDLSRSNIYRDNSLPLRRSSSNSANVYMPIYLPSSHITSTTPTSMRPPQFQDHLLPPRKERDYSIVPPTPGNSPQSPHASPTDYYRPSLHTMPDRTHGRPLPVPPPVVRRQSVRDGAPKGEATGSQYSRDMPNPAPTSLQDGQARQGGEAEQPVTRQPSGAARDQPILWTSQTTPTATAQQPTSSVRPHSEENQKDKSRSSSKYASSSKDKHRSGGSGDATRAAESTDSDSSTHGPRFIAPSESRRSNGRAESTSTTRHTTDDSRQGRSFRDHGDSGDRRESRSEKQDRGYDSSREDKSKSSRYAQDREHHTSSQRQERSSRSSGQATSEKSKDHGRGRRDSLTQRAVPPSIPAPDIVISPRLVPIVRAAPRPDQLSRSYSRGGQPITTTSQEVQITYQRPITRHSADDRPIGGNGRSNGRDPSAASSRTGAPEPHRRYSDSDAPPQQQPFFQSGTSSRAPPQPGPMRTRALSTSRSVRWNDNLVCPSPSAAPPRRDGWFNRRGDQLWTNDGLYMPCPAGQEYPPDLDDYPDYGEGWMNEKGVRIDMGHRLIPKPPLRPALKQSQPR